MTAPTTPAPAESDAVHVAVTWFDGQTSAGVAGTLTLWAEGHLTLRDALGRDLVATGEPGPLHPDDLVVAPPLGASARAFHLGGRGRGETQDLAALQALEERLGRGMRGRLLARVESAWPLVVVLALTLILSTVAVMRWGVPWAAEQAAMALPASAATQVGHGTLKLLDTTVLSPSKLSAARKAELRDRFRGLSQPYDHLPLSLHFRRGVGPNAFALPDGTVLLTDELERLASDDDQILAVLAHEIGHVHHRHGLRMALETAAMSVLFAVMLGDASEIGNVTAGMPAAIAQAQFSQAHETQADDFALDVMMHAGIAPRHFAVIMRRLQESVAPEAQPDTRDSDAAGASPSARRHRAVKRVQRYLASHPPTGERLRRFERHAASGADDARAPQAPSGQGAAP